MTGFRHRKDLVTNVSLIIVGVFITHGDIGIGTILGSAVFNVLFVIGLCGVGAGTVRVLERFPFSNRILEWNVPNGILCLGKPESLKTAGVVQFS